ncbi:MAG: hypothetical protein Q4F67_10070 [Propionibacteriaceae bacterium]|nr:hypothetical protein [Propionibacteriaceae bacterium]
MSALVEVRLLDAAVQVLGDGRRQDGRRRQVPQGAAVRRRPRPAPTGRMAQPVRAGHPVGVRGPEVAERWVPAPAARVRSVPPPALEVGVRLTDRGVAVVMGVAVVLMILALFCIGTTALRVTAEPGPGVTASGAAAR